MPTLAPFLRPSFTRAVGPAADLVSAPVDERLAPFRTVIVVTRWSTLAVGLVLGTPALLTAEWRTIGWALVLLLYATIRSAHPITFRDGDLRAMFLIVADICVHSTAIVDTGYWQSPFVFCLITSVIIAGFAQGFAFAMRLAVAAATAVTIPMVLQPNTATGLDGLLGATQWSIELLLVALVAGYGRRIFGEAEARHSLALDRMSRLAEANALLYSLHRVAQVLPASLDLGGVLQSTSSRLRDLFDVEIVVILLRDETVGAWAVAAGEGAAFPPAYTDEALPVPLRDAVATAAGIAVPELDGSGLTRRAASGLYAPLQARGSLVGLIALEHPVAGHFDSHELELLEGFVESAALAIDNARWFSRLRTIGADEERLRIARDLHDRTGQSLAYLAFELERIGRQTAGTGIQEDLQRLHHDVRGILGEIRGTLSDLRTEVSESRDIGATVEAFLGRVRERSGLDAKLHSDTPGRLPLPQERELWRIAQEAIINVERHARASSVHVHWWTDGGAALLEVRDNGRGFLMQEPRRSDAYGMIGMRERADAIGAQLEVESAPGAGTLVRCRLGAR